MKDIITNTGRYAMNIFEKHEQDDHSKHAPRLTLESIDSDKSNMHVIWRGLEVMLHKMHKKRR